MVVETLRKGVDGIVNIDKEMLNRIQEAVVANRVATRQDLMENYAMEIVMRPDRLGYFNPRVTQAVDDMSNTEVTHIKFIPLVKDGVVAITPAAPTEPGATEFMRGESRRTAMANLRVALNGFQVEIHEGRKLAFPVSPQPFTTAEGKQSSILVFQVKRPESKKSVARPRKKKDEANAEKKAETKAENKAENKAEQKPQVAPQQPPAAAVPEQPKAES